MVKALARMHNPLNLISNAPTEKKLRKKEEEKKNVLLQKTESQPSFSAQTRSQPLHLVSLVWPNQRWTCKCLGSSIWRTSELSIPPVPTALSCDVVCRWFDDGSRHSLGNDASHPLAVTVWLRGLEQFHFSEPIHEEFQMDYWTPSRGVCWLLSSLCIWPC